jgi:hypothetical protein
MIIKDNVKRKAAEYVLRKYFSDRNLEYILSSTTEKRNSDG